MGPESLLLILILMFVARFSWQFMATKKSLATTRIESHRSPQEAIGLIRQAAIAQLLAG